jgi:hypothetical protein
VLKGVKPSPRKLSTGAEFMLQQMDWIVLAGCAALAWSKPGLGEPIWAWIEQRVFQLAKNERLAIAAIGALTILARLALLPWMPVLQAEACATVAVDLFS